MFEPLQPRDKLLKLIRDMMRELQVTETELGRHLGLTQSGVSKILHMRRRLSYEEAEQIVAYLIGRVSLVPHHLKAGDYATKEGEIVWAYDDERLGEVSKRMFVSGLSQLPVRIRKTQGYLGVITEQSILRRLISPYTRKTELDSIDKLGQAAIEELGVMESMPSYPYDTALVEIAQVLLSNPAILIEERGEVTGIITRADLLKLFYG